MQYDLLGYLLNALDTPDRQAVEQYLERSPEGRQRLHALKELLAPLACDVDTIKPPPDLVFRTLRRVAQQHALEDRPAPKPARPAPSLGTAIGGRGWRRADVLLAAAIAFILLLLVPPALLYVRHRERIVACADNLRKMHPAFVRFAEDHQGRLPGPEASGPLAPTGSYAVKLRHANYWDDNAMRVACPANYRGDSLPIPSPEELHQAYGTPRYDELARNMGGCYGYHMGYLDDAHRLRPLQRTDGDMIPLMADRPPRPEENPSWRQANSANHGGRGQNVLHVGGNVSFHKSRHVGEDDLFLNQMQRLAPGRSPWDAVLAPSEIKPLPLGGNE